MIDSLTVPDKAAIKLQTLWRGYHSRKKFSIKQLTQEEREFYPVFVKGNDPKLGKLLPHHEKVALIGTSGFKSLKLALKLSDKATKLIIIDNSQQVRTFWQTVRNAAQKSENELMLFILLGPLLSNKQLCRDGGNDGSAKKYVAKLLTKYPFNKIKTILSSVAVISQSWADKDTLIKINNTLKHIGIEKIYAYPSNIVAYLHQIQKNPDEAQKVLAHIEKINPEVAFHSDLDAVLGYPKKFFSVSNHKPSVVTHELGLNRPNNLSLFIKLLESLQDSPLSKNIPDSTQLKNFF